MNESEKLRAMLVQATRVLDRAFDAHRECHGEVMPDGTTCPYRQACRSFDEALAACVAAGVTLTPEDWRRA